MNEGGCPSTDSVVLLSDNDHKIEANRVPKEAPRPGQRDRLPSCSPRHRCRHLSEYRGPLQRVEHLAKPCPLV